MKVQGNINLITYNNNYGLSADVKLLSHLIKKWFPKVTVTPVDFFHYQSPPALVNIYLEIVNRLLMPNAKMNILIPNQEWYYRTWIPYLPEFDEIWAKTSYGREVFHNLLSKESAPVQMISWESQDRLNSRIVREASNRFNNWLHVCGKSIYKQTQRIIELWQPEYPKLTIMYSPRDVKLAARELPNVTYLTQHLPEEQLIQIMNSCGIHLCCSEMEGFGHYIQEAKSCQAVVVTTGASPMKEMVSPEEGFLIKASKKRPMKKTLGSRYIVDDDDFRHIITTVQAVEVNKLAKMGRLARESFLRDRLSFRSNLRERLEQALVKATKLVIPKEPDILEKELPSVSVLTLTYQRKHFFKLALYNWKNIDYPADRLEWVIIDDSSPDQRVKELLPEDQDNITYYLSEDKLAIGHKRNLGIQKAKNDYIVMMDDDDYYPPQSVKHRITSLIQSGKNCVGCSSIGCFHIDKYISMINVPPHPLPFEDRFSEASLAFTKQFWQQQSFRDQSNGTEARELLRGRCDQVREISWKDVLVSLLHSCNTSHKIVVGDKPNGCHYGFSDELFLFLTSLEIGKVQ